MKLVRLTFGLTFIFFLNRYLFISTLFGEIFKMEAISFEERFNRKSEASLFSLSVIEGKDSVSQSGLELNQWWIAHGRPLKLICRWAIQLGFA